jgi:heterodisulfide reductase subunit A
VCAGVTQGHWNWWKIRRDNIPMKTDASGEDLVGAAMVVGGGIAGIQAAMDLADAGFYVYLIERSSAIGGIMAGLDKTFPTNDCAI